MLALLDPIDRADSFSLNQRMDWTHLHLALNHIPVLGPPFLLVMLLWSWARGEARTLRFCLTLCIALAALSIAIKFTGDFAAEKAIPGVERTWIEHHEQTADQASTGVFLTGLAAGLARWLSRKGRTAPTWSIVIVIVLTVSTLALMARTANSGGQIRHPEIRR